MPDERVDKLAAASKSKKKIPAIVEFFDIAGLVKGASTGAGLGNKFLSHIRECSAIVEVLRCFGGSEIIHVEDTVDPMRDMDIINTELMLKDLDTVNKRMESAGKEARGGKKEAAVELAVLEKAKARLEKGELIFDMAQGPAVRGLQLLSAKPQIYLLNGNEGDVSQTLKDKIAAIGASYIVVDVGAVTRSAGSGQAEIPELVREAYKILNLISFFTTGEDETRAWTIEKGMKAPQAAGVIHTDFEKKFIRMETINWQKLLEAGLRHAEAGSGHAEAGSWSVARQKGWLRQEGKEYVVQDGDVCEVKHG